MVFRGRVAVSSAARPSSTNRTTTLRALLAGALVVVASGSSLGLAGTASAGEAGVDPVAERAVARLVAVQGADGSVPEGARPDQTAEAVMALAVSNRAPGAVADGLQHIAERGPADAASGPFAARVVMALHVVGEDPRRFAGVDWVDRVASSYDDVTGTFDGAGNLYGHGLAALALVTVGDAVPERAITHLVVNQCPDGGWSHREGCLQPPDVDTTAIALAALRADGRSRDAVAAGFAWLQRVRNGTGCWGLEEGEVDNANSCGLAIMVLRSTGADVAGAVGRLLELEEPGGGFRYRADIDGVNDYATVQALPAIAGLSLPPERGFRMAVPTAQAASKPGGAAEQGGPASAAGSKADRQAAGTLDRAPGAPAGSAGDATPDGSDAAEQGFGGTGGSTAAGGRDEAAVAAIVGSADPEDGGGVPVGVLAAAGVGALAVVGLVATRPQLPLLGLLRHKGSEGSGGTPD